MTPSQLREKVVIERAAWVRAMLSGLADLPLGTERTFREDPRNAAAAESYLRRALEALLDLGRHILAKGFGIAAAEYKQIARLLQRHAVLDENEADLLERMAGYRNRMVHFYQEVGEKELYELSTRRANDIEGLLERMLAWIRSNPDRIDHSL